MKIKSKKLTQKRAQTKIKLIITKTKIKLNKKLIPMNSSPPSPYLKQNDKKFTVSITYSDNATPETVSSITELSVR
jgi:hypothetical protein